MLTISPYAHLQSFLFHFCKASFKFCLKMNLARNKLFFRVLLLYIACFETLFSKALDSITSGQSLVGNQTVLSQNGTFELGFFTPGNSRNYYIGIWYGRLPNKTVVWAANRDQPVSDPYTSELKLFPNGSLALLNQSKHIIWGTNAASELANSTIAKLLDTGNLVVVTEEADSSTTVWQSFDYPTDHWLPGGKIGYNKLRNEKLTLNSWRSSENPASSLFSVEVEPNGTSHLLVWNESHVYWTSGDWTGSVFTLVPEIALDLYVKNFRYISNENESYFTYDAGFPNALTRFLIDESGRLRQFVWRPGFQGWSQFWLRPSQPCQVYGLCGTFGSCNEVREPTCSCIPGFEPESPKDWELGDHSQGCRMKIPLKCDTGGNDTFMLVPDTWFPANSESHTVGTSEECKLACLKNCSCTAYAFDNGCFLWTGKLMDLKQASDNTGKEFHVRVAASDDMLVQEVNTKRKTKSNAIWIIIGATGGFSAIIAIVLMICAQRSGKGSTPLGDGSTLVVFKYQDLRSATKNFSEKLGEGGFGTVFKGTLPSSGAIAVKRLKSLAQEEKHDKQFRAEVSTIGLIQHVNLVHLLGFSTKGMKRFLVYEYMTNGSLESHLFQRKSASVLDWKTRYHIIIGTARGLSYLHEKCRDCIIHCDIKPDNILLDSDFNPKVADFGLAKLMGREFSRVLTTMKGTRGYLAPEWISGEAITPKADVFSYGMLLFEVISGKRNIELLDNETSNYFPAHVAYRVAHGEGLVDLLDESLGGDANIEELARVCKIACYCVQDDEKNRPTMGQIVQMLEVATEVGIPPFPHFLQAFLERPREPLVYMLSSQVQ